MILAKVLSPVVSTEKNKSLRAKKIFVVQPLNMELKPLSGSAGTPILALDHVQAGEGDIVIICREGNGCRQLLGDDGAPVNAVIAGIVDAVSE
jgi:ethanolamine utilization protein EutN